jgi:hypothetical protein
VKSVPQAIGQTHAWPHEAQLASPRGVQMPPQQRTPLPQSESAQHAAHPDAPQNFSGAAQQPALPAPAVHVSGKEHAAAPAHEHALFEQVSGAVHESPHPPQLPAVPMARPSGHPVGDASGAT